MNVNDPEIISLADDLCSMQNETNRRYRLHLEDINYSDSSLQHPSGGTVRLVTYTQGTTLDQQFRTEMQAANLMLGVEITNPDKTKDNLVKWKIPAAARPPAYDLAVQQNELTYDDNSLFFDSGFLLGSLLSLRRPRKVLARCSIGSIFAVTNFEPDGERHIFFVPGTERVLGRIRGDITKEYRQRMHDVFGERFTDREEPFLDGFDAGVQGSDS